MTETVTVAVAVTVAVNVTVAVAGTVTLVPNYISVEGLMIVVFDKKYDFSDFFFYEAPGACTNRNDWRLFD